MCADDDVRSALQIVFIVRLQDALFVMGLGAHPKGRHDDEGIAQRNVRAETQVYGERSASVDWPRLRFGRGYRNVKLLQPS